MDSTSERPLSIFSRLVRGYGGVQRRRLPVCPQSFTAIHRFRRNASEPALWTRICCSVPRDLKEFVMDRLARHLPERFPVGTRYVVEGSRGSGGRLRIHLRYLKFPDGRQINLPVPQRDLSQSRVGRRTTKK
jgi:hypothetical protein